MNCDVVKDLIPLCIDGCCSEESEKIVKEHIESCDACKKLFEDMSASPDMISVSEVKSVPADMILVPEDKGVPSNIISVSEAPVVLSKINDWKASVLQSVLLYLLFAMMTAGVALEAKTPAGLTNGFWALNLVIPATGFMLSLANWYFVRLYKNRKIFSNCSFLATLVITTGAYIWAGMHYEMDLFELFSERNLTGFFDATQEGLFLNGIGILVAVVFCILSKALSNQYAKMLGKE